MRVGREVAILLYRGVTVTIGVYAVLITGRDRLARDYAVRREKAPAAISARRFHRDRSAGERRLAASQIRNVATGSVSHRQGRRRFARRALVVCPRNDLAVARMWPNGSSNGDSGPNRRNAPDIKRQLVQETHH